MLTCTQIDSRVVLNSITAPKGRCRDYQKKHITARKAFLGISLFFGIAFLVYWASALQNFNFTSSVFAYCWIWNVMTLYFMVSVGLHCRKAKVAPSLGPQILANRKGKGTPVEPWNLGRSFALILFQTAFDVAWAGVLAYSLYFIHQVGSIGDMVVMAAAFVVAPLLLTIDLVLSQMVFVPFHFIFAIGFLFLWVLVLWGYTSVTYLLGGCDAYINASACMCSRWAVNQSDMVQCYNSSVGYCKWTEFGRCGWIYNPEPKLRYLPQDLALLDPPPICAYESFEARDAALLENGTHNTGASPLGNFIGSSHLKLSPVVSCSHLGHCSGDYPDTLYSITDPLFFLYVAAMCAVLFGAHCIGILITCIREVSHDPMLVTFVLAGHSLFVISPVAIGCVSHDHEACGRCSSVFCAPRACSRSAVR